MLQQQEKENSRPPLVMTHHQVIDEESKTEGLDQTGKFASVSIL